ncbi:MAG TPA: hypothetical protein EYG54_09915, partial [Myxococcales bacterium]|nr:hypothetical protein [Myxococcales bacterium]
MRDKSADKSEDRQRRNLARSDVAHGGPGVALHEHRALQQHHEEDGQRLAISLQVLHHVVEHDFFLVLD